MKSIKPELLGGFQDFLPNEMILRQKIISTIEKVYQKFGFLPLDTPCMERLNVLVGEETEFNKSIFTARIARGKEDRDTDLGEDFFALRFDLTVPLARVVAAYPDLPKPFKRYQIGKVWRGEKPQQGRFREFYQFDIDTIGARSIASDTEIVIVMHEVMKSLEFKNFIIKINNRKVLNGLSELIKCKDPKELFRVIDKVDRIGIDEVIRELEQKPERGYESFLGLSNEQTKIIRSFLEMRSDKSSSEVLNWLSIFLKDSPIGFEGVKELTEMVSLLRGADIKEENMVVDLSVARGLDYYNGPVFETFLPNNPDLGSVFSGGRFDGLSNRFLPDSNISGVGASVGLDRIIIAIKKRSESINCENRVLVTVFDHALLSKSFAISQAFRSKGLVVECYIDDKPLKAQIAYAVRREFTHAIIIGPEEISSEKLVLKDLGSRTQQTLTIEECLAILLSGKR